MKTYKLLIDSAEYPKGMSVKWNEEAKYYEVYMPNGEKNVDKEGNDYFIDVWQIENRPNVWELQEEKLDLRSPEAERMREEARSKRWEFIPKDGYKYYIYLFDSLDVSYQIMTTSDYHYGRWNMGNCHRTKEEAIAWGDKYARYFLTE